MTDEKWAYSGEGAETMNTPDKDIDGFTAEVLENFDSQAPSIVAGIVHQLREQTKKMCEQMEDATKLAVLAERADCSRLARDHGAEDVARAIMARGRE